jgi:photosystem II stability/assembly factor-like uncharacterized protein
MAKQIMICIRGSSLNQPPIRGSFRTNKFKPLKDAVFIGLVLLLPCFEALSQIQWTWLNPWPPPITFNDVLCLDSTTIIAVGNGGNILRSTNAGNDWESARTQSVNDLLAVSFADRMHGTAVGNQGTLLFTTNGGMDWTQQITGTSRPLRGVSFADSLNGLAVGGSQSDYYGVILKTTNGGSSWLSITVSPPYYQLNDVSCMSPTIAFLVTGNGYVYRTTDGGYSWGYSAMSPDGYLFSIQSLPEQTVVAAGYRIMKTTNSGNTWTTTLQSNGLPKRSVSIAYTGFGFAVGNGVGTGLILRTTDYGSTWTELASGTNSGLGGVNAVAPTHAFVVGGSGLILRTTDAGTSWTNLQRSFTSAELTCVKALDSDSAIICGTNGVILGTTDRGRTWNPRLSGSTNTIHSVSFSGTEIGTAVGDGGTIIHSSDAGRTWLPQSSNTTEALLDVQLTSASTAYVVGDSGTILHTTDAGLTWLPQSSGTNQVLTGVSFYDAVHGMAVGGSGPLGGGSIILRTSNSGNNWAMVPPSSGVVHQLGDVAYLDSTTIVMVGSYYYVAFHSNILRSSEAGSSWQFVAEFFNSQTFKGLSFPDRTTGYAVASESVLRSSDSGYTWGTLLSVPGLSSLSFYDSLSGYVVGAGGVILGASRGNLTHVQPSNLPLPKQCFVDQNYPNPFNPATTIRFHIDHSSYVSLRVFDLLGREVATLVNEEIGPGTYEKLFDGTSLASGVYFCRLQVGTLGQTTKLLLLR